jgi:CRP-like cAMP-binding protein
MFNFNGISDPKLNIDSSPINHASPQEASQLLQLFKYIYPISSEIESYVIRHIFPIKVSKGKKMHLAGEICDMIYFIKKGAVRGYIKEGKKDTTTWISVENELVAPIYSFIMQTPSIENMEAIEDCDLLAMSHRDMHHMFDLYLESNILARRLYEKYYADAEVRALTGRIKKAEKKYEYFLRTYAHLSNRIPLTYIASFLGINLETLSRVRGQKRSPDLTIVK